MADTLKTALVGGGATIIGALIGIIPNLVNSFKNLKNSRNFSKERLNSLNGIWHGKVTEYENQGNVSLDYSVKLLITTKGIKIKSDLSLYIDSQSISLKAQGNMLNDDFFVINFKNSENKIKHFGTSLCQLSCDTNEIIGKATFYGFDVNELTFVTFTLKKELQLN